MRWVIEDGADLCLIDDAGEVVLRVELASLPKYAGREVGHALIVRKREEEHVEIYVSPKGRNVRTFVAGREVHW